MRRPSTSPGLKITRAKSPRYGRRGFRSGSATITSLPAGISQIPVSDIPDISIIQNDTYLVQGYLVGWWNICDIVKQVLKDR